MTMDTILEFERGVEIKNKIWIFCKKNASFVRFKNLQYLH
jgi:hypothetical protein